MSAGYRLFVCTHNSMDVCVCMCARVSWRSGFFFSVRVDQRFLSQVIRLRSTHSNMSVFTGVMGVVAGFEDGVRCSAANCCIVSSHGLFTYVVVPSGALQKRSKHRGETSGV